jgi:hypothetical protein
MLTFSLCGRWIIFYFNNGQQWTHLFCALLSDFGERKKLREEEKGRKEGTKKVLHRY